MLKEEVWHSYDKDNVWLSFDALKVTHRVTEVLCGNRYSITLFTPGKLERLTPSDWDTLAKFGFPIYLYDVSSLQMRRLPDDLHLEPLIAKPTAENIKAPETRANEVAAAQAASSSGTQDADAKYWKNIPLPSIVDTSEQQIMNPQTLLDCCQCVKDFIHEYDLSDHDDTSINIMRTLNHRSRILEQLGEMTDAAKDKNRETYLLSLVIYFTWCAT